MLIVKRSRKGKARHFVFRLRKRRLSLIESSSVVSNATGCKRILILMADSGGGHRASAEALKMAFLERYRGQFQIDIIDLWMDHTPWPLNQIPKAYRFMINDAPWLWKFFYEIGERPKTTRRAMKAVHRWIHGTIARTLLSYNPDLIISVHPLLQDVPLRVLDRLKRRIPFVTVVTDLSTIPASWFDPHVAHCFVATERAYQQGLERGMNRAQMSILGLPIRPNFGPRPDKDALRTKLGMDPDLPAALLVGGGEGMGPVDEVAHALARRLAVGSTPHPKAEGQLVVICGRNHALAHELSTQSWPVPTTIQGFVGNMNEWMAACDCIITKAGPGTIAEALASGLPVLLFSYIAGQEEGNVPYVIANGVGTYCEDPKLIAEIVCRWFGPGRDELQAMAQRARALGRPQATFEIVDEIAKLLS